MEMADDRRRQKVVTRKLPKKQIAKMIGASRESDPRS